jgi:23S rRNA (adenine1618-N6)-methyltransferase
MLPKKKEHPTEKPALHPRNKHRARYNFNALIKSLPALAPFVRMNEYRDESIDFSNAEAVLLLNKALLKLFYGIDHWNIPAGFLCPPIPGRADYTHHIADVLGGCNGGKIPTGNLITCLDIGVGANCIYPILGHQEYGWSFVGSDVEALALQSASKIIEANTSLKGKIELRLQRNAHDIFRGVIRKKERFDITLCNPPFHASYEEAQAGTLRKLRNLSGKRISKPTLNFGGKSKELWCEGGEEKFVRKMIEESKEFSSSCFWFSTLIAKSSHLKSIYAVLKFAEVVDVKTIPMGQGNKTSRLVAWTFLTNEEQKAWVATRWNK